MADQKVSNLPALNGADVDSADLLYIVDSSAGTAGSKKITIGQYQLAPYSAATANTVVYFNGTKVSTSSSALTFDGTNLGVGTSSPATKLEVSGAFGTSTTGITLTNSTGFSASNIARFDFKLNNSFGGSERVAAIWALNPNASANNGGALVFGTSANGTATTPTEGMRLDPSGNLGLGVTPANWSGLSNAGVIETQSYALVNIGTNAVDFTQNAIGDGAGNYKYRTTEFASKYGQVQGRHQWFNAPSGTAGNTITFTQAMTLTSGGDLLVGTTSQPTGVGSSRLGVVCSASDYAVGVNSTNATPYGLYIRYTAASPNGTGSSFFYFQDSTAVRAYMQSNGGLANYSGNDSNLSDRREKTNFAPAKSYLDTICAIPVQTFNYIDQSEDDPGLTLGVVAQDVQAVAPELVQESNWGTEDNPKVRLSIYQTDLQYALMKCIQELKAENDDLRARVAALEAK
jgi:hypothetical protein